MRLFLFDVDGVLVHSRAYHIGLKKAVAYFSSALGLGDHTLTEADIDAFEAATVTVEWELSAIAVARMLIDRLRAAPPKTTLPDTFWALGDLLRAHPHPIARPDFLALAQASAQALPGQRPSLAMLERFLEEIAHEPYVTALNPVLRELLGHCYDIQRGPTMQIVQAFAVGAEAYRLSYGHPPRLVAESLLETADSPYLSSEWRTRLLDLWRSGALGISLYTARPSLPPREAPDLPLGYTPEAEAALKLVGLEGIPVMAVGRLQYVAERHGLSAEDLVKPSPVQSLAAMGAAGTGLETDSVEAALRVAQGGPVTGPLVRVAGAEVHVFEDSASSLRSATRAVALLNDHGLGVTLTRHGIAPEGSPKVAALSGIADHVWPDVNTALRHVLMH